MFVCIKHYREQAGISQMQLAKKIGVCQQAVAKWESGTACPSTSKLPKLARALGCTIDDLYKGIA